MSENVVTTDWVRENYALVVDEGQPVDYRALREFDAWYESEKRKWQAEAWTRGVRDAFSQSIDASVFWMPGDLTNPYESGDAG